MVDKIFRKRVIDAGHTLKEVNEAFRVDSKRYYTWEKQLEETSPLNTGRQRTPGKKTKKVTIQLPVGDSENRRNEGVFSPELSRLGAEGGSQPLLTR
jgi:hypothetical protein